MKITEENLKKSAKRLSLQPSQMPRHIAIIMDGNGRWAQQKGLQRVAGHQKGGKTVEQIALDCVDLGIEVLTLYSFSTENWKRPKAEVDALMALYTQYLVGIRPMMMENKVKLVHLGRLTRLPENLKVALAESMEMTAENEGMILALALNYSGRAEIIDTTKKIAQKYKSGRLTLEEIDELCISRNLYTEGLPDPDLLIRTANEQRVSNFLLWQISYTEFHVTKTLWPDFRKADVEKAILDYAGRTHSFGEVKSKQ
jgi:undecaprenyl diphosphate synthase